MALTTTEEAQTRALIEQNAALLSLAASEPTIISKLAATKASLSDLPSATVKNNTDLFLVRQGTEDKSITGALAGGDAAYVSYTPALVGAVETDVESELNKVKNLGNFGANPSYTAAINSAAVTAALSWMSANNGRVRVDGIYTINGDLPVGANGFHFFGNDKYNDGFNFAPQSASITGGVHGYFLPDSATNTSRMVFENLCLKSTYDSRTWTGSTVFAGLRCSPNSGVTHSNVQMRNCYLLDPSFHMLFMAPHLSGLVKGVIVENAVADVTSLQYSSRSADVLQCIIEGIDYNHTSTYGLRQILNVQVRGGSGRGWRTYADLKRGTSKFVVDGVITEDMSDCHHSVDGAFFGAIDNVVGTQTSALLPTKNFIEMQGEDITVGAWKYNGTTGLGAIAAVLVTSYAYPTESATAYHQSKRIDILNGTATGIDQNVVRLQDAIDCTVNGLKVSTSTLSGVSIEHPTTAPNGGANTAVPTRNVVDNITGVASVGTYGVNIAATAIQTRIGNIEGYLGKVTGNIAYTPIYPDNENPNRQMILDSTGFLTGWSLTASCTVSQNSSCPAWAAFSVLINGANAAFLDEAILGNKVRVAAGDVVNVRASTLFGTATATGILFQELDSTGGFLSNDFQNVPANSSTWTENIIYHMVTGSTCANVRVIILPNTNFNSAVSTGTSYWADVIVTKKTA